MCKSVMPCALRKTNASNIYRLATTLSVFKKLQMGINIKPHNLFLISLSAKMSTSSFFLSRLSSHSLSRRQVLGHRARSFGRWGRHELRVRVQMVLPLLSLRSCCTSVDELEQHLLGDRVWDAVAHSCGQRETCLTWGLIKAADSPQGEESGQGVYPHMRDTSVSPTGDVLRRQVFSSPFCPQESAFLVATLSVLLISNHKFKHLGDKRIFTMVFICPKQFSSSTL